MTRPILASIDLQALKQNLTITRRAAPDARVWSVVKATHMDTALNASECAGHNRWFCHAQS